jgi:hypothetical protein
MSFRRWLILVAISAGIGLSGVAYDCCKEFGVGCGIGGAAVAAGVGVAARIQAQRTSPRQLQRLYPRRSLLLSRLSGA